jgi:hypothetical protein
MARLKPDSTTPKTSTYHRVSRTRTLLNMVFLQVCGQNVAFTTPRVNQRRVEAFVNLFAQPPDVHVNDVRERVEVLVPDVLGDLVSAYELAGP